MPERPIDVISLIGTENLHASYRLCMDVYGELFDKQMATMCMSVISLQDESDRPGGISFNEAAFLMLITEVGPEDGFSAQDNVNFNHTIRAAILWNMLERPSMVKELENLKKVLGDVMGD